MNILIINGSPKGDNSCTLYTCLYLEKQFPDNNYAQINAGAGIRRYEKDFSEAAEALSAADLIIFSYPVYTFIVPSQLHRFIELIKENNVDLSGKYATQITTSKHFYDITAHAFIEDNCHDLGMKVIHGLSADMDDLLSEKGRKEACDFFKYLCFQIKNDIYEENKAIYTLPKHVPATVPDKDASDKPGDIVIVADLGPDDVNLKKMIARFKAVCPRKTRLVNIRKFPFKGGCISCFNCAPAGECIYKDGFDKFLRNKIQTAEAIVLAFSIKDHSMGSLFKTYDDRQFCNGHRTVTMGMPFGYLVSGNYSQEENLRTIINARAEVGGNYLAGVASDETNPDKEIDALALKLDYAVRNNYTKSANFYGVGGMKIFRDLIWQMQGLMKADHKFYKAHNQYDFPQKKRATMLFMYLVGGMLANPKLKKKIGGQMTEGMIAPYKKVLEAKDSD